ncbi:MAG TPA: 3'-5' exonuclease [Actinomycetota bacterium]
MRPPARPAWWMRSRPWREVEFASLDFETTGLDRERDAVVSFGVVPVRGGRVVVREAVHQLVLSEVPASAESMRIHGILPKDLADAQPFPVAGQTLRLALAGRFVLAWFAGVEIGFLCRLYGGGRRSWVRRTIDVRQMAIELEHLDQDVRQSLSSAAEHYGVPVANPHEALDDAMVTAQLFLVLADRLEERGLGTARSLLRLTRA